MSDPDVQEMMPSGHFGVPDGPELSPVAPDDPRLARLGDLLGALRDTPAAMRSPEQSLLLDLANRVRTLEREMAEVREAR